MRLSNKMNKRLVIALGGNALGKDPLEQLKLVTNTASVICDLIEEGYDVVVGHGNGPQVGMVNLAFENSHKASLTPAMPFPECGAMTQGYIGYHLQQAIGAQLHARNINKSVATLVTQVVVEKDDPAFLDPTKPIGSFYSEEEAKKIAEQTGYVFKEDAGRGYRRVVASPMPKAIVELDMVEELLNSGNVVITVGGGGIPVVAKDGWYEGIPAVIDKDRASARLALDLDADMLLILTAVDKVSLNFHKSNQVDLDNIDVATARQYISEGHFAPGSMLPKIEACIDFVEGSKKGQALISSLAQASNALKGLTGTLIVK